MSREVDQSIIIGDDLQVQVIAITPIDATLRMFRRLLAGRITEEVETKTLGINEEISPVQGVNVEVVDVRHDKVRIGVTVPKNISVHRLEVWDAIRRQNRGT